MLKLEMKVICLYGCQIMKIAKRIIQTAVKLVIEKIIAANVFGGKWRRFRRGVRGAFC